MANVCSMYAGCMFDVWWVYGRVYGECMVECMVGCMIIVWLELESCCRRIPTFLLKIVYKLNINVNIDFGVLGFWGNVKVFDTSFDRHSDDGCMIIGVNPFLVNSYVGATNRVVL